MRYAAAFFSAFLLAGCTGTGQPEVSFPAYFIPTTPNSFDVGDVTIDLAEARVAFGPAYFCASASGSATLCETALGEIRDEVVIDALQVERQMVGTYHGFVGEVRSGSYDLGIHWFLPQQEARASAEAPAGHSAFFRGTASRAGTSVDFEMNIDVVPQYRGQRAVPTVPVKGSVTEKTESIELRFDVESWLSTIDYDEMLGSGADPYVIGSGEVGHDSVVIRMVSNDPVEFGFTSP
ncbi:MAG: hypothetical protein IPM54_15725 [Polyangiaceae bacterium]|nr:hypothetical protein [Polyangiaceae bacterium]